MNISSLLSYPIKSCAAVETDWMQLLETGPVCDRRFVLASGGKFLSQRSHPQMAKIKPRVMGYGDSLQVSITCEGYSNHVIPILNSGTLKFHPTCTQTTVKIHDDDPCPGILMDNEHSNWFSEILGVPVRLIQQVEDSPRIRHSSAMGRDIAVSYADGYPILVLSEESVADLNTRLIAEGLPEVDASRFRPNIILSGCEPHQEDTFGRLRITTHGGHEVIIRAVKPCTRCRIVDTDQITGVHKKGSGVLSTLAEYRKAESGGVCFGMNYVVEKPGLISRMSKIIPV